MQLNLGFAAYFFQIRLVALLQYVNGLADWQLYLCNQLKQ